MRSNVGDNDRTHRREILQDTGTLTDLFPYWLLSLRYVMLELPPTITVILSSIIVVQCGRMHAIPVSIALFTLYEHG